MADELDSLLAGLNTKVQHDLETADEMENNILAAGFVMGALLGSGRFHDLECVGYPVPGATNVLETGMDMMKSRYRITVERIPD